MPHIDYARTYSGSDSVLDILSGWTAAELDALDAEDAATVAAYCAARRAVWDGELTCPATVAATDWEDACGCQDLGAMPAATTLLRGTDGVS
jgi:hypothetical protein